jgi:hypothetical protein
VALVDGGADHLGAGKGFRVFRPPAFQPLDEVGNGRYPRGEIDHLLRFAGLLAHPGEVEDLDWLRRHGGIPALRLY